MREAVLRLGEGRRTVRHRDPLCYRPVPSARVRRRRPGRSNRTVEPAPQLGRSLGAAVPGLPRRTVRPRPFLPDTRCRLCRAGWPASRPSTVRSCSTSGEARVTSATRSPAQAPATCRWTATLARWRRVASLCRAASSAVAWRCRRDGMVDVCYSSNVLEHVPRPWHLARGAVAGHTTRWDRLLSPSPSGTPMGRSRDCAVALPRRRPGGPAYERDGPAAEEPVRARACSRSRRPTRCGGPAAHPWRTGRRVPRYHPRWSHAVVRVPGLRNLVTWNLVSCSAAGDLWVGYRPETGPTGPDVSQSSFGHYSPVACVR